MRATLLVVVAHAATLAALCVADSPGHAKVLHASAKAADPLAENVALRKAYERLASELDESEKERARLTAERSIKQPPRLIPAGGRGSAPRRRSLATPAPTPLTPIPTPLTPIPTTATPSATPSVSPVPTTEGVTTHSQLAAAIANTDDFVVVVEGDVVFPSLSVIIVDSGRCVSVVGRSAVDGGRVVFDGGGHSQHFWVTGGTLHIAFVNLVNGTASQKEANCRPDLYKCSGASILVQRGGTLVVRSCDIRGGGPGVSGLGDAFMVELASLWKEIIRSASSTTSPGLTGTAV